MLCEVLDVLCDCCILSSPSVLSLWWRWALTWECFSPHGPLFALTAPWDASSNTFIPQFQRSYIPQVALNVNLNLFFEYLSPGLRLRFPTCVSFPKGGTNCYPDIFPCSLLGRILHWAQGSPLYLAPCRSVFKWKLSCFHIPGISQRPQGSFNFVLISLPLNCIIPLSSQALASNAFPFRKYLLNITYTQRKNSL